MPLNSNIANELFFLFLFSGKLQTKLQAPIEMKSN